MWTRIGGSVMHMRVARSRKLPPCRCCGEPGQVLCDGPVKDCDEAHPWARFKGSPPGGFSDTVTPLLCSAPLCRSCAVTEGPDRHLCPFGCAFEVKT